MRSHAPQEYVACAEESWAWVLDQVRYDDGPWIPWSVEGGDPPTDPPWDRDGMHSGVAGLVHVLAEIRLRRPWSVEERSLAHGIGDRLEHGIAQERDCSFFDGLVARLGALLALERTSAQQCVRRLLETAGPEGWPLPAGGDGSLPAGAPSNDLTTGTAGVLLGATWAMLHEVEGATELAEHAAAVLSEEAEPQPVGVTWHMVPPRWTGGPRGEMPGLSHGVAGVATALALAGAQLGRPELVDLAREGTLHLLDLGRWDGAGLTVPRTLRTWPRENDPPAFGWCHGSAGLSLLFAALEHAGVPSLLGEPPAVWHRRCLEAVRASGLPARLRPGFWDNDGRCCGTAGVADVLIDSWQRTGDPAWLDLAVVLADALLERALRDGGRARWRFVEHRATPPLLPPGVGWMQGAAGICGYLFRIGRVLAQGPAAPAVLRMDSWWASGPAPGVSSHDGPVEGPVPSSDQQDDQEVT